jgi:hypothetical protein
MKAEHEPTGWKPENDIGNWGKWPEKYE